MLCENKYCLYQKENKCSLEQISIDILGMCDDCISICLEDDFLEAEKEKQLVKFEKIKKKVITAFYGQAQK